MDIKVKVLNTSWDTTIDRVQIQWEVRDEDLPSEPKKIGTILGSFMKTDGFTAHYSLKNVTSKAFPTRQEAIDYIRDYYKLDNQTKTAQNLIEHLLDFPPETKIFKYNREYNSYEALKHDLFLERTVEMPGYFKDGNVKEGDKVLIING